ARSCTTCDTVLAELEHIDDDTDSFGVDFVKINDKRLAKQYGITKFPALTYFREKEPIIYEGDLMDEAGVLDFLTSLEAMDLPDRIEEVNSKILSKIIEDSDYVAVLFYKPECKKCIKALQELENIDDEADQLDIGFVKIHDEDLAEEYNLGPLPKLVYYRHQTPIVYEHELQREEDVLEWLVENKATGDDDDVIEEVNAKTLKTLIQNIDNLVVLFYDDEDEDSESVLQELESIDDDCAKHGIQFVRIDDPKVSKEYGIDEVPAIVYFEKQIPNVYDDDLSDEEEILEWLLSQLEKDEIEDVTDEMLDKLIKEGKSIAVLFYDNNDKKSEKVLNELENIDDECDQLGINFVKMDDIEEAKDYGVTKFPKLVYFEQGIPTVYEGSLDQEEDVLDWLERQTNSDEIEDVTDEMLDMIIEKMQHVAVLFYDKDSKTSQKVLSELENIDDECDQNDIAFVKIDDDNEAKEWGIEELPTMILFERGIPHIYEGDLLKEEELLGWLVHQKRHSEIPEITDEMKDKLMQMYDHVAIIFYDKDDKQDIRVLNELENIDDELEKEEIVIARLDNAEEAREYGLDHLPALVYFENEIPAIYEGDLMNEEEVLEWLKLQKYSATIEEVTDEILQDLIDDHEYVCVYFSGECEEGEKCDKILDDLENIDDELDEAGIIFVTTEDMVTAKKYNIKNIPSLVFFRNKDPLIFAGDMNDEDEVLAWLTDEETLEIPGKIEEVNIKMLEKILSENEHIVVFFYHDDDKKAQKIIAELENIDDECEEKDIDFVKTSDDEIDKEYDLETLPALVFYRNKFRQIYAGDLMNEEEILEWVLEQYNTKPEIIESVDRKTLQVLVNEVEHLAVLFYDDDCETCPKILEKLETIDDDTDKHHIQFVKANDEKLAHEIGIFSFPALVYYETGVPIMYDGNLKNEKRILQWLIDHKRRYDIKLKYGMTRERVPVVFSDPEEEARKALLLAEARARAGVPERSILRPSATSLSASAVSTIPGTSRALFTGLDNKLPKPKLRKRYTDGVEELDREDRIDKKRSSGKKLKPIPRLDAVEPPKAPGTAKPSAGKDTKSKPGSTKSTSTSSSKPSAKASASKPEPTPAKVSGGAKKTTRAVDDDDDDEDDECFYVGLGHAGRVTKRDKKSNAKEDDSFRCCPAKVEKNTRVTQMAAQKISRRDSDEAESQFAFRQKKLSDVADATAAAAKEKKAAQERQQLDLKKASKSAGKSGSKSGKGKKDAKDDDGDDDDDGLFGDLLNEYDVLDWMHGQKTDESIQEVERDELLSLIDSKDFLGVVFYVEEDPNTPKILRHIELIDDEAADYGILLVKCSDRLMAKKFGFRNPPGVTYFRKGKSINYDGDIDDEEELLDWLTDPHNMEMTDHIEKVNRKMFQKIRQASDYLAVFFYSDDCKQCPRVLAEIEHIDDEADGAGINFVKIDDKQMAKELGVYALPGIVFFKLSSKEPVIYAGDLNDEDEILNWLMTQKNPGGDIIEDLDGTKLLSLIEDSNALAVYFWNKTTCEACFTKAAKKQRKAKERKGLLDAASSAEVVDDGASDDSTLDGDVPSAPTPPPAAAQASVEDADDCEQCSGVLESLENIDDDCDRHGIMFVKTDDLSIAEQYGITEYPVLVYFEDNVPNVFEGSLDEEEEVLQWLITQKTEDRIELITRVMLESMVDETQYLAVYFYKINCNICDQILEGLEVIDDELDVFGIHMVKIQDPQLAKRYSIKTFPALVYFRNGNPLIYEGDLQNEQSVLEWLVDDDNRELADEIEEVNERMLDRLMEQSPLLCVFYYDEDCSECDDILEELELIDGEVDLYGIDFVKVASLDAAHKYGVTTIPSLVYYRKQIPMLYDGDMHDHERVMNWLTSQDVFEIKNEIEEVNRKMLNKLLDENEFLAVYFFEEDHEESEAVLEKLELIDSETDNLDITFVKMGDPRYARKWGVTKLPAIVYFRKRFPSIYRGDMYDEQDVLEWLRKNRFRQPELNIFMYALIALGLGFIIYTAFLLQCFKPAPPAPVPHPKQN
uniref:Thioredoxin domain-containing protein n=1 Tax=Anopheles minimus TaxID=112268 RepID=A0A182WC35_9DIPT